jgi:hypothetical protein
MHECTAFHSFHAARIEVTASKGSIPVLHECVVSETMSCIPSNNLVFSMFTTFSFRIHGNRVP